MVTWNPWIEPETAQTGRWRMVQRKLGRGLDFLISGGADGGRDEVLQLDLDSIRPNPFQPRREFVESDLADLAASIREHGVLQPVVVRRQGDAYQLVAGERRWRACQQLALATIPAIVREADDAQMLELALVENIQRADLNPIELAHAFRGYLDRMGVTQDQAASRLGKSRPALANTLRLLDLPQDVQDLVSRGTLTAGHARALLSLGSPELQRALAQRIVAEGWSVREAERAAQEPAQTVIPPSDGPAAVAEVAPERDAHFRDLEAQLRDRLGTRVRIQDRGAKGRILIEYYTPSDLERVLELLLNAQPSS